MAANKPARLRVATVFLVLLQVGPGFSQTDSAAKVSAKARADLTPAGTAWEKQEAKKISAGEVDPTQVEVDAGSVTDGVKLGADPDSLVLIALEDGAKGRPRSTNSGQINRAIANVLMKLSEVQRSPRVPRSK
jgi:hypothetical protein